MPNQNPSTPAASTAYPRILVDGQVVEIVGAASLDKSGRATFARNIGAVYPTIQPRVTALGVFMGVDFNDWASAPAPAPERVAAAVTGDDAELQRFMLVVRPVREGDAS